MQKDLLLSTKDFTRRKKDESCFMELVQNNEVWLVNSGSEGVQNKNHMKSTLDQWTLGNIL